MDERVGICVSLFEARVCREDRALKKKKKSGAILSVYDATETRDVRGKKKDKG